MKAALALLVVVALPFVGCQKSEPAPAAPPTEPPPAAPTSKPGESVITAPLDYIAALGKAQKATLSRLDHAKLIDAIQKFDAGEGRPPKNLEELVTAKYLAAIPAAPPGTKLEYSAGDGSFKYVPIAPAPAPAAKK